MRFFKNYDYYLIILTTLILFAIGLVCVYGIAYYNYLSVNPGWTKTIQYDQYLNQMNSYLYPFLVMLLLSLGLCIPKRLFEQDVLIKFSVIIMGVTVFLTFSLGIDKGLFFVLATMTVVQFIVLALTLKRSKVIRIEKQRYIGRLGSALLHLGLVILILDFVGLRESYLHISIFWIGVILISVGNIFSFYPDRITSFLHTG
ncbi:MAG: hypothetical protein O8C66_02770 [Candidatus Methanoperedens sp.]|nr:hypothetical protein [Candidatus Methanoperedens sp.]MCZ7369410.1 hypothetical protein [Candidatus Methanoperedens sp.]